MMFWITAIVFVLIFMLIILINRGGDLRKRYPEIKRIDDDEQEKALLQMESKM